MADMGKVMKGIWQCLMDDSEGGYVTQCWDCPYYSDGLTVNECKGQLRKDFADLLKEKEPKKPLIDEYGNKRCAVCGKKLQSISDPDLFCCKCGQAVNWDA